jgi:hypothetical protein
MSAAGENQRGGATLSVFPRWSGQRNPGMALRLDWINEVRVNLGAVERRVATLANRRSITTPMWMRCGISPTMPMEPLRPSWRRPPTSSRYGRHAKLGRGRNIHRVRAASSCATRPK